MTSYVALLRAVNVGGRKLKMSDLKQIADELGLEDARTFIASGNLLFRSDKSEAELKLALEARLKQHMGADVGVMIRSADEMTKIVKSNPFPDRPGNRATVIFLDRAPPGNAAVEARNRAEDEAVALGIREIYAGYGNAGIGRSKLQIPAAATGTMRNMNTVAKLAELAREKE